MVDVAAAVEVDERLQGKLCGDVVLGLCLGRASPERVVIPYKSTHGPLFAQQSGLGSGES